MSSEKEIEAAAVEHCIKLAKGGSEHCIKLAKGGGRGSREGKGGS